MSGIDPRAGKEHMEDRVGGVQSGTSIGGQPKASSDPRNPNLYSQTDAGSPDEQRPPSGPASPEGSDDLSQRVEHVDGALGAPSGAQQSGVASDRGAGTTASNRDPGASGQGKVPDPSSK